MFQGQNTKVIVVAVLIGVLGSNLISFVWRVSSEALSSEETEFQLLAEAPVKRYDRELPKEDLQIKTSSPGKITKTSTSGASGESAPALAQVISSFDAGLGIFESSATQSSAQKSESEKVETKSSCSFSNNQSPKRNRVILNEINWAGAEENANHEWIELKNISSEAVNISNWSLVDQKEQIKFKVGENVTLPAYALYLIKRGEETLASLSAPIYSGALSNTNEGLQLFNNNCDLEDETLAEPNWEAGNSTGRLTMERSGDLSWYSSADKGGSPGEDNSTPPENTSLAQESSDNSGSSSDKGVFSGGEIEDQSTSTTQSTKSTSSTSLVEETIVEEVAEELTLKLLIYRVQITGGPGLTTNDFIEIENPNSEDVNLKGYRLVKRTKEGSSDASIKSWTSDEFIGAGDTYIWANSGYTDISTDVTTSASIANDNGIAIRFGPANSGEIIDSLAWGAAINVFIEGQVFPTNPEANQVLERSGDSDNNASDFSLK